MSRADATEEMRAVSDFLRRRFAQMSPFVWNDGNDERIAFAGDRRHIRFIAPAPEYSPGPGLLIYMIEIESDEGGKILVLSYSPFDPGTGEFSEPYRKRRTILTDNLTEASFEYFGAETDEVEPAWQENWQANAERFPSMIRIRTATEGSAGGWPDLMFTLHVNEKL